MGKVIFEGQGSGKSEEASIQERRSTFDGTEHAGAVYLDQNLFRQVSAGHVFHCRERIAQARVLHCCILQFLQPRESALLLVRLEARESRGSLRFGIEKLPVIVFQETEQTNATPS